MLVWSALEIVQDNARTYVTAGSGSHSSCPAASGHTLISSCEMPLECQKVLLMFADQRADFGRRRLALMCLLQTLCADGQFALYPDMAAQMCCALVRGDEQCPSVVGMVRTNRLFSGTSPGHVSAVLCAVDPRRISVQCCSMVNEVL